MKECNAPVRHIAAERAIVFGAGAIFHAGNETRDIPPAKTHEAGEDARAPFSLRLKHCHIDQRSKSSERPSRKTRLSAPRI
jgi:hypothetical protein